MPVLLWKTALWSVLMAMILLPLRALVVRVVLMMAGTLRATVMTVDLSARLVLLEMTVSVCPTQLMKLVWVEWIMRT